MNHDLFLNNGGPVNFFDEQVFAHVSNGSILAVLPEDITLSQSRSLGSIPAVVRSWSARDGGWQVVLSLKNREREIHFRAHLNADEPKIVLQKDMMLYMRFSWDKVIEYQAHDFPAAVEDPKAA